MVGGSERRAYFTLIKMVFTEFGDYRITIVDTVYANPYCDHEEIKLLLPPKPEYTVEFLTALWLRLLNKQRCNLFIRSPTKPTYLYY